MVPAHDVPSRFYAVVRGIGRFWIWFLFQSVEARHPERVPPGGPVLLCINHPNNLIDSLLVGAVLRRQAHFLATAALFRNPLVARFLRGAGAIPVYRRQDDPDQMDRNVEMFAACLEALARGRLIGIYPEGTTHAESRVQRIKTGAARIALAYEAQRRDVQHGGEPGGRPPGQLTLIPVGLTFQARKSFRGRVLIAFGEPVPVAPYLEPYRDDPAKAIEALTTAIQWGMEGQVIHVDRIDAAEVVRAVEDLYRGDLVTQLQAERRLAPAAIDTFRLSRTIVDAVSHFKAREPERVEALWQRIQHYRAMLAQYHVRDQAVRDRLRRPPVRARLRASGQAVAGLPFFAYGAVVNALPYFVPRWLARRVARKETDYATVRLLASIVAFPLFWGLETWLVWRLAGPAWAVAFALSLPMSGLVAYHYLGGLGRLRSQLRFGALAVTHRQAAARLLTERQAILAELEHAKTGYLASTHKESS
ncbi:MAG: lysophospholipid acyltransferase family protein [Candidatus Rokuibacteriota bacterium]